MANINAPRGFKLARTMGGNAFNDAFGIYRLNSGYATNIFVGDVVKLLTTGYLAKASAGDQMRGVVVAINWIQASGVPGTQRYWPASTTTLGSQDVEVIVADDPNMVFEAVFTNSTSVPATADIGATFNLYDSGGNTSSGLSGEGVDYSTLNTTTQQWRFLDFVKRPDNDVSSAYSRGFFMPASHDFRVTTGI